MRVERGALDASITLMRQRNPQTRCQFKVILIENLERCERVLLQQKNLSDMPDEEAQAVGLDLLFLHAIDALGQDETHGTQS
jgi:hypothetical protein